jgi:hypothetical protein
VLISIALVFICSGCTPKEQIVIKKEYIKEDKYSFNKIDFAGTYIELGSKEIQKTCTPSLLELNTIYKEAINFYDWQIDEYSSKK